MAVGIGTEPRPFKELHSMHDDQVHQLNYAAPENTDPTVDEFEPAPEGGTRAWTVAAGGGAIFFSTLGFANSFGTFEEYYLHHQLKDRHLMDWVFGPLPPVLCGYA
jgi:hypothetical protein